MGFFYIVHSDPSKHVYFIVAMTFISLGDGLLAEVLASVRKYLMEVQWRPERFATAVVDIPSSC
jgi:hypothetical protein